MQSGRLATARLAIRVWSSSLLPDPVVPATRPWGPSLARSTTSGPLSLSPMTAAVDRPERRQPAAIWAGAGGSRPSSSRSRTLVGMVAPASARRLRRIGARLRATFSAASWSRRSGMTSVALVPRPVRKLSRPGRFGSNTARAWHSSGSKRSESSRQMEVIPASGPRRRILVTTGRAPSRYEPSMTTRWAAGGSPRAAPLAEVRSSISADSSPASRTTPASIVPIRAMDRPSRSRAWGSQRHHDHFSFW